MIRHRNYYEMAAVVDEMERRLVGADDTLLLYLPLAHNFGRLIHLLAPLRRLHDRLLPRPACASPRRCSPSGRRSSRACRASTRRSTRPSSPGSTRPRASQRRDRPWALGVGRRGQPAPPGAASRSRGWLAVRHRLADRLVYSKVKERLGGRLRLAISGGAPLAREIIEFFHALDILILEGYGLTECTTAAPSTARTRFRFGTVGRPLPGVEVRLADDGELVIRSQTVFAGYYKDEEATRGGPRRRRLARAPATSPRSTRTASSRSPTARRTSSSPPAARTSRRRTSRTS